MGLSYIRERDAKLKSWISPLQKISPKPNSAMGLGAVVEVGDSPGPAGQPRRGRSRHGGGSRGS